MPSLTPSLTPSPSTTLTPECPNGSTYKCAFGACKWPPGYSCFPTPSGSMCCVVSPLASTVPVHTYLKPPIPSRRPPPPLPPSRFGAAVATVSRHTVIVTTPGVAVYVFTRNPLSPSLSLSQTLPPPPSATAAYGTALAATPSGLAVCDPAYTGNAGRLTLIPSNPRPYHTPTPGPAPAAPPPPTYYTMGTAADPPDTLPLSHLLGVGGQRLCVAVAVADDAHQMVVAGGGRDAAGGGGAAASRALHIYTRARLADAAADAAAFAVAGGWTRQQTLTAASAGYPATAEPMYAATFGVTEAVVVAGGKQGMPAVERAARYLVVGVPHDSTRVGRPRGTSYVKNDDGSRDFQVGSVLIYTTSETGTPPYDPTPHTYMRPPRVSRRGQFGRRLAVRGDALVVHHPGDTSCPYDSERNGTYVAPSRYVPRKADSVGILSGAKYMRAGPGGACADPTGSVLLFRHNASGAWGNVEAVFRGIRAEPTWSGGVASVGVHLAQPAADVWQVGSGLGPGVEDDDEIWTVHARTTKCGHGAVRNFSAWVNSTGVCTENDVLLVYQRTPSTPWRLMAILRDTTPTADATKAGQHAWASFMAGHVVASSYGIVSIVGGQPLDRYNTTTGVPDSFEPSIATPLADDSGIGYHGAAHVWDIGHGVRLPGSGWE